MKNELKREFESNIKRFCLREKDVENLNLIKKYWLEGDIKSAKNTANLVDTFVRDFIPPAIYKEIFKRERIKHATEEDLEIIISQINYQRFSVALRDTDAELNLPTVTIFNTEESAKHYAEKLAGYLDA